MKALLIGLCLMVLMFAGCRAGGNSLWPGNWGSPTTGYTDGAGSGASTTVKVDWLFSLFMLGAVAGLIAGFGGIRFGWIVCMGNVGGIVLSLMVAEYGRYLALGGAVAAACVVVAMLWRNRQFQFQSVKSVQQLKDKLPEMKDAINETFWNNQNGVTEKLVGRVKSVLKKKDGKSVRKAKDRIRKQGQKNAKRVTA